MVAIGIIAGCGIVISYLLVRLYRQKKEIYDFTEELQRCLTLMKAGEDIGNEAEFKDSLWDKIYQDLQELMDVWNRKNRQSHKEKEQIKELISDISHQGRTPMANIKIYLEILEEEQEEYCPEWATKPEDGKLIKQTERLDFLMQSLVKLSRLETGIIEICEKDTKIFEVLGLAVAAVVPGAEAKEISVHVDCPETLKLFCDAKWTQEAIFNLLENAVKYTPKGGSIYISVMEQEVFGKISIRDTGRGIPAEHQAQIFQRFYREPEVHDEDGIGIGLYLSRKIVTMQDGYMEVHSESGKGAEFCIYLPMK
jgi:signal transduction histidine kinase